MSLLDTLTSSIEPIHLTLQLNPLLGRETARI